MYGVNNARYAGSAEDFCCSLQLAEQAVAWRAGRTCCAGQPSSVAYLHVRRSTALAGIQMFFHLQLNKDIEVEPRHFGPNLQQILKQKVTSEVEGTCSGTYGFMLMVTEIMGIGQGKIREGTGSATFHVEYTCLVFRPFKGEVLDAVVASVNKMGFFADAGPLQIFVSQHLIPSHYRVEITDDASFESEENAPPIKAGAAVRVRLVGIKVEANQLFCVATIMEDFLGIVGD